MIVSDSKQFLYETDSARCCFYLHRAQKQQRENDKGPCCRRRKARRGAHRVGRPSKTLSASCNYHRKDQWMVTWHNFEAAEPAIAAFTIERLAGRVAYLATVRPDGGPRVHPVTPIIGAGHLFLFMEPTSPKGRDLQRDSRYALHCGVEDNQGGAGEVIVHGRAELVEAPD